MSSVRYPGVCRLQFLSIWTRLKCRFVKGLDSIRNTSFPGCDRGFGHTLTTKLSLEGYTVYASCLDVDGEGALSLKKLPDVNVLLLDVTNENSVEKAAIRLNQDLRHTGACVDFLSISGTQ